jgi:hypothetical protein
MKKIKRSIVPFVVLSAMVCGAGLIFGRSIAPVWLSFTSDQMSNDERDRFSFGPGTQSAVFRLKGDRQGQAGTEVSIRGGEEVEFQIDPRTWDPNTLGVHLNSGALAGSWTLNMMILKKGKWLILDSDSCGPAEQLGDWAWCQVKTDHCAAPITVRVRYNGPTWDNTGFRLFLQLGK